MLVQPGAEERRQETQVVAVVGIELQFLILDSISAVPPRSIKQPTMHTTAPECPSSSPTSHQQRRIAIPSSTPTVVGFPVSENQFNVLQQSEFAESPEQDEGLQDPRQTRAQRLQAAKRTEDQRFLYEGVSQTSAPPCIDNPTFFEHSLSVNNFELGTGDLNDALYISDVNDVACINDLNCKRISVAGQERSAGRPGNRPLGARKAARNAETCLGPYATRTVQSHHMGHNTHVEDQASSRRPRGGEPVITSSSAASSSRRPAAEDRPSPATVVLQPRRPPYFCGGFDEDVYVWTSIVDRWFNAIQGEPTRQLTFIVSLLRGTAYEWYLHYETRTGCPGDWTTLRRAMLERFGTSIRAERARAGLYQLKQNEMTVLQYASAFESYLAQIGEYDESYYLIHFIFGLRPEIMRGVYIQQPASLLAAKNMAEKLELTCQLTSDQQKHTKKQKTSKAQHRGTQERRSSGRHQMKTYSTVQSQRTIPETQYSGCRSAHPGALVVSCPERHGPAAVWRSLLKDLP